MVYSYHFLAAHNKKNIEIDGIIEQQFKIVTFDDYTGIKKDIINAFHLKLNSSELTIRSLTLIHEEKEVT